jgi:hypothetical protein
LGRGNFGGSVEKGKQTRFYFKPNPVFASEKIFYCLIHCRLTLHINTANLAWVSIIAKIQALPPSIQQKETGMALDHVDHKLNELHFFKNCLLYSLAYNRQIQA